jgi:rubrerythrin
MADLDVRPMKVKGAYQDQYLEAAGLPANLMEVLAITQVFERRAIWAYRRHLTWAPTHPRVRQTLEQIMADERWHLRYVRDALRGMAPRYGADAVDDALARCAKADGEVYELAVAEHRGSFPFLEEQP